MDFIYLVVVANVTLFKHGVFEFPIQVATLKWRINLIPLVETIKMLTDGWVVAYAWYQVIANILVFIPLVFLLPVLFKQFRQGLTVLLAGIAGSLLIEIFQVLTPRNIVDIDDVIFNTMGALLGYMAYLIWIRLIEHFNLMKVLKKVEIHLTKPIIRVTSVPFVMMLITAFLVSVVGYYESTFSNDLSDEELVAKHFSYEGELISKQGEKGRYVLKDCGDYLDLSFYQSLPLNRVRKRSILQWHEDEGKNYSMKVLKKVEIHLTKPIIRVTSVPFVMMLITAFLVSVVGYYESTFSNDLSDEELVAKHFSYEGELISKQGEKGRYVLKDCGDYLDLSFYQSLPLNRVRKRSILQWHEDEGKNYSFTFVTDESKAYSKSRFVMIGKNNEATQIKITYLKEVYIEDLPIGNFVVLYPHDIIEDEEIYKLYDGEKSETFSIEFLNESKEVIDCL